MLDSYLGLLSEVHLEEFFHVLLYLWEKHNLRLTLDPTYLDIDHHSFKNHKWVDFYGDVKIVILNDMPNPRGESVDLRMHVESDHSGYKSTCWSSTGFHIFMSTALIQWISKKQPTIETSVFGMKHGMETLRGIRYKLRMMGIPIKGPSYIYGENMAVIHNT